MFFENAGDEEDEGEDEDDEDNDEIELDLFGAGSDDDEDDEDEEDEEDEDDDEDDDFMASFCSFAASLMNMSPFEKMRANGKEVEVMTLEDLQAEVSAMREKRRRERTQERSA